MDFTEIRRRTIVALFSDDVLYEHLVLKGGNAISLVYGYGTRASIDLDFSIEDDFEDVADIQRRIFAALEAKFVEAGYLVFDKKFGARPGQPRPGRESRWGGYQFEFKLIEKSKQVKLGGKLEDIRRNAVVVGPNQMRSFVVDLSKYERCGQSVISRNMFSGDAAPTMALTHATLTVTHFPFPFSAHRAFAAACAISLRRSGVSFLFLMATMA